MKLELLKQTEISVADDTVSHYICFLHLLNYFAFNYLQASEKPVEINL